MPDTEQTMIAPAALPEPMEQLIFILRGRRVMLSTHLAQLYGVEVRALVQAVKRNPERFPEDFMFQLTDDEFSNLKSQIVISSWGGSRRANPYAFTEQGIAMLSSVLRSPQAIAVNVEIMRAFVRLRRLLSENDDLARRLDELEAKTTARFEQTDAQMADIIRAIRALVAAPDAAGKQARIGFRET